MDKIAQAPRRRHAMLGTCSNPDVQPPPMRGSREQMDCTLADLTAGHGWTVRTRGQVAGDTPRARSAWEIPSVDEFADPFREDPRP